MENFRECISTLTKEINEKYQSLDENQESVHVSCIEFVRNLQSDGSYQVYMTTLLKSVAMLISEKYKLDGETKNSKTYEVCLLWHM